MNIDDYVPDLPEEAWARVRPFVLQTVHDVAAHLPYPLPSILNAVAHHVDWCVNVGGFAMTNDVLFRREVIGYAVDMMPTSSPSTQGRRRSLLLRVGEQTGAIGAPPALAPLSAAHPSQPYSPSDVLELCSWAEYQSTRERRASALALIGLGLGAGLPTRDLCTVRTADISVKGDVVRITGKRPRTIPVNTQWAPMLAELRDESNPDATLFRPRAQWHTNIVTTFVDRSSGLSVRPTTQRLRATWIVERLTAGMPMHQLLHAAGVVSMDALVRYEKFLPAVD